ncbi:MAG: hypothetical protein IH623_21850 [Verrucomicrobia bacterium]|nr:hypothetical protein [Verrucomicrobiota bacterium]
MKRKPATVSEARAIGGQTVVFEADNAAATPAIGLNNDTAEWMRGMFESPVGGNNREMAQIITGHLDGIDEEGRILFVAEPGVGPAEPVIIGTALSDGVLVPAARNHQRALAVRTNESPSRLVLISLLRERIAASAREAAAGQLEVTVEGETVRLTAGHEIELKCGNASIVLRQSGRVILKGTHVVTSSSGPVRIKGATVDIN